MKWKTIENIIYGDLQLQFFAWFKKLLTVIHALKRHEKRRLFIANSLSIVQRCNPHQVKLKVNASDAMFYGKRMKNEMSRMRKEKQKVRKPRNEMKREMRQSSNRRTPQTILTDQALPTHFNHLTVNGTRKELL